MLSIEEALERIAAHAGQQPIAKVNLDDALGLYLAKAALADVDSPPFTKSLMDGYAVRAEDIPGGKGTLERVGEIVAGQTPTRAVGAGEAMQIMTGAPIPSGADAVVMVERTTLSGTTVAIDDAEVKPGQNIMPRGREYEAGQEVLPAGHRIGPAEMGLLASIGVTRPEVFRRPTVAILSTGDEIVPAHEKPGPGQIRNSNEWTLSALALRADAHVRRLGIARDDEKELRSKVEEGLSSDVLLLSGGVSAGKRDFVPRVLADLGVEEILHGVAFKPGKPMWFGARGKSLVFGLPGNPVSVFACFEVFVRTALRARVGKVPAVPTLWQLPLAADFNYPTRRPTYHPARIISTADGPVVEPISWYGSPDLLAITKANGLVVFPTGEGKHRAGDKLSVLRLH